MKRLIVNADDFGRTAGVNRGIVQAHEQGIVTSSSLMVREAAAAEAASYGRDATRLSLGLHVDLGEWRFEDGEWVPIYATRDGEVADDVDDQLSAFRRLVGSEPTHLDSHQHVHLREPARSVLRAAAHRLGVPLRHDGPVRYCGDFYGQTETGEPLPEAITEEALEAILARLPEGVTELCCHPGDPDDLVSSYRDERAVETAVLCSERIRRAVERNGIELCTFGDL
jgi:chitin disaccharide deacetylase